MRLQHLCDLELAYRSEFTLVRPYGGEAGSAYGEVEGTLTGEKLRGTFRGVNHPRRRADGAMLPETHGLIRTEDGSTVLFSFEGRPVWVDTPAGREGRQLLRTLFEAEAEAYRWLNNTVCMLEGKINARTGRMQAGIYLCVNELA